MLTVRMRARKRNWARGQTGPRHATRGDVERGWVKMESRKALPFLLIRTLVQTEVSATALSSLHLA